MADTSKPDQDLASGGEDLLTLPTEEKQPENVPTEQGNESVKNGSVVSTASAKIVSLRNNKKSTKTRLTKAKNQLTDLLQTSTLNGTLPSKNTVRRAIKKVKTEQNIIEKIVESLKEADYQTNTQKKS